MRVPIFMPSRLEKYIFFQGHMDYQRRYHPETPPHLWPLKDISPFNETNVDAVPHIVGFTDYWRFPDIQYFDSIPDLLQKLVQADFHKLSQQMHIFHQKLTVDTVSK